MWKKESTMVLVLVLLLLLHVILQQRRCFLYSMWSPTLCFVYKTLHIPIYMYVFVHIVSSLPSSISLTRWNKFVFCWNQLWVNWVLILLTMPKAWALHLSMCLLTFLQWIICEIRRHKTLLLIEHIALNLNPMRIVKWIETCV